MTTGATVETIEETTSVVVMVSTHASSPKRLRKLQMWCGRLVDSITIMALYMHMGSVLTILLWGVVNYLFLRYLQRPADDNDNHYRGDDRRGPQRRRNDDGPRRRYEEPPFPKLRRLLLNIASSTKLPQDEAIEIAKFFGEHFDDERLRSDFFDVFVQL